MSEYEGKTHRRRRCNVDLSDLLFYEATGRMMIAEEKAQFKEHWSNRAEKEELE